MIIQNELNIDIGYNQEQRLKRKADELPCICHLNMNRKGFSQNVSWHWHEVLEIDYVLKGTVQFRTEENVYSLDRGDAFFINTNVLHACKVTPYAQYYAIMFEPQLVSGQSGSVFDINYVRPVTSCRNFDAYPLRQDQPSAARIIGELLKCVESMRREEQGYEFSVRETLGKLWLYLYEETSELRSQKGHYRGEDSRRTKKMLQYIYDHYPESVTLDDIADAAGVGKRESTRCFRRIMKDSPIRYLNHYRIQMASKMLLETDQPVSRIAEQCGFLSDSYFVKMFRETFDMPPGRFRRMYQNVGQ